MFLVSLIQVFRSSLKAVTACCSRWLFGVGVGRETATFVFDVCSRQVRVSVAAEMAFL